MMLSDGSGSDLGSDDADGRDEDEGEHGGGGGGGKTSAADAKPVAVAAGKYVPPALRAKLEAMKSSGGSEEASKAATVERRITGLLNRLSDTNLQAIVKDVFALYREAGRRVVSAVVTQIILTAAADGPRATEQFAAVAAAFVSGLAGTAKAQDLVANFTASLAAKLELAMTDKDSLAQHNLIMLLAYLYGCGVLRADLMYTFMDSLRERFWESDVSALVTLLNAAGLQLRSDDPVAMKEFVLSVHARAAKAGA
eukprot:gene23340-30589_t